jgi:hypothetical protein
MRMSKVQTRRGKTEEQTIAKMDQKTIASKRTHMQGAKNENDSRERTFWTTLAMERAVPSETISGVAATSSTMSTSSFQEGSSLALSP